MLRVPPRAASAERHNQVERRMKDCSAGGFLMRRWLHVVLSVTALGATLGLGGCYVEHEHHHGWYGHRDRPIYCRGYECRERRWW
jgi:hypothetical protein